MVNLKINALRACGFRRAAIETETGDLALSFEDQDGQEQWLLLPLEAAGPLAAGLLTISKEAATQRGMEDAGQEIERVISEGMGMARCQVSVSLKQESALLTVHTVSGLAFEFQLRPQAISEIRTALRQAASILNRGERSQSGRRH